MKEQMSIKEPKYSPWGEFEVTRVIRDGIFEGYTAGHGGILVHPDVARECLSQNAINHSGTFYDEEDNNQMWYAYEEDEAALIVFLELEMYDDINNYCQLNREAMLKKQALELLDMDYPHYTHKYYVDHKDEMPYKPEFDDDPRPILGQTEDGHFFIPNELDRHTIYAPGYDVEDGGILRPKERDFVNYDEIEIDDIDDDDIPF